MDVGCGPGDSGFDIIRKNPKLTWTFEDLQPVITNLEKVVLQHHETIAT